MGVASQNSSSIDFGVVYFIDNQSGFLFFKNKLVKISGTADIPSGDNLFWCNLTAYELRQKGLSDSRFIKDDFFDLKIKAILKELGLDIIKLTDGFENKDNIPDITQSLFFINDILVGVIAFAQKYLLVDETKESLQLKDVFAYETFAQAIYACATQDFKLHTIRQSITDIFKNSDELTIEATQSLSRNWVVAETPDNMPSKQEAELSTVLYLRHRQDMFRHLMSINIPKGAWREVSIDEIDNNVSAFLEQNLDKPILCRINFKKTDKTLSKLLNFGGLRKGLGAASIMNNWMTILEFNALKKYLIDYSVTNILICEERGPHPLLALYQKVREELGGQGSGWNVSYLAGFIELHIFESINKKNFISNENIKSPAGAYLTSAFRLYSLLFALEASVAGQGKMKTVDCFWVFAYGIGKVGIRIPKPESASSTNFDDRAASIAQKIKMIPPILNCMSFFENMPKSDNASPENIVRWLNMSGKLDKTQELVLKTIQQLKK